MPVVYSNSLYDGNNVFNRDAIHFKQSLVRRRLTELIKNAYALNNAVAHIRSNRRNSAAETVNYVVILNGNYLAALIDGFGDRFDIKRFYRVHIQHTSLYSLLEKLLGSLKSNVNRIAY